MLAVKLIIEGLGLGFLLYLICAIGIRNGAVGMVFLYNQKVQDRVVELGLTSREDIRKRGVRFRSLCLPGYLIYVLVCVYVISGARGFWAGFWQGFVILSIMNLIDRFLVDDYWVGHTNAWIIPGTEDLRPYITAKDKKQKWLIDRYGKDTDRIWEKTVQNYNTYLKDLPDYGGKKNGHARAIYGGLLVFALYPALPDEPPIGEMQEFVNNLFMGPFTKLGKIFNLNRSFDMWLIDKVFRKSGNRDRKDIRQYPAGFVNVDEPYDREHHVARYHFTQCPNAEFAKSHNLLHVLPLMCNSDFFGIGEIHGQLIRCGTCGNSDKCDYLIVGSKNEMAAEYETVTDEQGFLVSRRVE